MKTALVFPGQGSQYIGMGHDFFQKYSSSREIYKILDDTMKSNMSDLIFRGDEDKLSQTKNSQPSIMATSIAIFQALKSENLLLNDQYDCVAGHSLGEYSALVANESLTFQDAVRLLKVRSKAMQESMPLGTGGMVALIGVSNDDVLNCVNYASKHGKIFVANDNAPSQVVLSGDINSINYILNNYKDLKIKRAIKLPVSAPFHCELMQNAALVMKNEISNYSFKKFKVPLFSNVTSEKCNESDICDLLVKQIVSKVRWREIIDNLVNNKVKRFIEIGPGNVLTNMIKRTYKDLETLSISKLEDLDKLDKINL